MHWLLELTFPALYLAACQCLLNTGKLFCITFDADTASAIAALLAFLFSVYTFIDQNVKNRKATADQKEKDRQATLEAERLRQQTIRLEWYKDVIKRQAEGIALSFSEIHKLKEEFRTTDLSASEKDRLLAEYKSQIFSIRDKHLEPILFVHSTTYQKLKNELDRLAEKIVEVIVNDELKLSLPNVYEREIGSKIKECQQQFYKIIYSYRGEE